MSRQFFDLRPGESVMIGNSRITLQAKSGQRSRILVESEEPTTKQASSTTLPRPAPQTPQAKTPIIPRPQ